MDSVAQVHALPRELVNIIESIRLAIFKERIRDCEVLLSFPLIIRSTYISVRAHGYISHPFMMYYICRREGMSDDESYRRPKPLHYLIEEDDHVMNALRDIIFPMDTNNEGLNMR